MNTGPAYQKIPKSRIATFDVYAIGKRKNHVAAFLEFDVTEIRKKLSETRRSGQKISFNAWLISYIARAVAKHPEKAAFKKGKSKLIIFEDVNVSFLVEKLVQGKKVPLPMVICKAQKKSPAEITMEIENAKTQNDSEDNVVLGRKTNISEQIYYYLPGFLRRIIWKIILNKPEFAYKKMGNVVVTSLGMTGVMNGWFLHSSVHPLAFGIGSVIKKPVVIKNDIQIREILNVTILLDHDMVDGAPMVRFIKTLKDSIERDVM
jgi:pyruvate/2-oxoglutarate dehydrogenase complex dihydrolipoamide acyltransferase (E2) component